MKTSTKTPRGPVAFVSRLWMKPTQNDVRHRVDDISKQFTGAGWKNLPLELVDEILGYLLDDLGALKACSLACKCLFGATRPLIHQRLRLAPKPYRVAHPKPKLSLFSRRKRGPEASEPLIDQGRLVLLRYTRHLTLEIQRGSLGPREIQEHLPHLRSITKLHTLTLDAFRASLFIPMFDECFGIFAHTLRHLDIRDACATEQQLLYIVCQFPLLEDLTIVSPAGGVSHPGHLVPTITQSPPLRGRLFLAQTYPRELFEGLAALPGGLHFRSLELFWCGDPRAVLAACGHTVTSISYLWYSWDSTSAIPLDLERNVALERLEFNVQSFNLSPVHQWIHRTLQTITSPVFNEFTLSILSIPLWNLSSPISTYDWEAIDASLITLAERNPDFRVVLRGNSTTRRHSRIENDLHALRWFAERYLPLVSSKGLVKFEFVPTVENQFWKSRILQTLPMPNPMSWSAW